MSTHGRDPSLAGVWAADGPGLRRRTGLGALFAIGVTLVAGCRDGGDPNSAATGGDTASNPQAVEINRLLGPLAKGLAQDIVDTYDPDATGESALQLLHFPDVGLDQYTGQLGAGDTSPELAYRVIATVDPSTGDPHKVFLFHYNDIGRRDSEGNRLFVSQTLALDRSAEGNWLGTWESVQFAEIGGQRVRVPGSGQTLSTAPNGPGPLEQAQEITQHPVRQYIEVMANTVLGYFRAPSSL